MSATDQHQQGVATPPKKQRGHTRPRAPTIALDQPGRLRVAHLLAILGVSHSTLYAGLDLKNREATPRYPRPDGKDGKIPYWNTRTVREFLEADPRTSAQPSATARATATEAAPEESSTQQPRAPTPPHAIDFIDATEIHNGSPRVSDDDQRQQAS